MLIPIEVAYADEQSQRIISLSVPNSFYVEKAIHHSGILIQFPTIDLTKNKVGIFGKLCPLNAGLRAGDRIEIYRPLVCDPKKSRKIRAQKQNAGNIAGYNHHRAK